MGYSRLQLGAAQRLIAHLTAGILCLALLPSGCKPVTSESEPAFKPRIRIFIVGEGENEASWPVLQAAAARFQLDDPKNEIIAISPKQNSPKEQQDVLESLKTREPSAICVLPCHPKALRSIIDQLVTSGCPVVTFARDAEDSQRSCYCGPAELEMGKQAATACSLALAHNSQTVITLNAEKKSDAYRIRGHGFREELSVIGTIQILKQLDCDGDAYEAANRVRMESQIYPRTGCWVMFDDWPLRATAANDRLLPLGCRMVVCNGSAKYIERVRKGEIQALVTFDFFESVRLAFTAARGRAENPMIEWPAYHSVEAITISVSELEWYERCWESWKRGMPSPPEKPWE